MWKSISLRFFGGLLMIIFLLSPISVRAQEENRVTLAQVNDATRLIDTFAQELVLRQEVPGLSIAVVFQDKVVYLKGYGVREIGKSDAVTEDTVFQLASVSKPIASTVVAALVSDGVVDWNTRISAIDPEFQLAEAYPTQQVTVRDLLSMRSGLPGNAGNELEELGYDQQEILHRLRYIPPASSLRSEYSYSNYGFTEGAIAAAGPTGKSWEEVSDEKLYVPLGMNATSSRYADFLSRSNRAELHVPVDGKWTALVQANKDMVAPAGGVSSSARDMAQWLRLQLGKGRFNGEQLIGEEALEQTHQPVIFSGTDFVTGGPGFYGMGWVIAYDAEGRTRVSHSGAFGVGARTSVSIIPSEELGIVVLTNAFPTGVPEAVTETFFDLVHDGASNRSWLTEFNKLFQSIVDAAEAGAQVYETPPVMPSPALPNAAYVGTYTNEYVGNVKVVENAGALELQVGPDTKTYALAHFDCDIFTIKPLRELPNARAGVTFIIGPDQKASQVILESLNDLGQGVLTRVQQPARVP